MKKRLLLTSVFIAVCTGIFAQSDMNQYIDKLMQKMTLQEKIGQLNLLPGNDITTGAVMKSPLGELTAKGELGAVLNVKGLDKIRALQEVAVKKSRLGIPLIFGQDVIHGYQTVFPIPLALSCSWDIAAIENSARIAAKEATALGINWAYSPMVDIALDPRWGRIAEGGGEDPFLGACIAQAMVKGLQGNYGKENVMACVKHYALYGAIEAGRDYNTVDMSKVRMYNQYFAGYKAAAEAGAGSFMTSFNLVDGIPATANKWLVTDVLRNQWKYDGFVVTDYGSIKEMTSHGLGDQMTCSALALKAGTDMDMCSNAFIENLEKCLKSGTVSQADIDRACRKVLEAKYKLGLFKDPYRFIDKKRLQKDLYTAENRAAARQLAAETFVLLKNDDHILPLQKKGKIALIGPLGDNRSNMVGCWSTGDIPEKYSTLKEAMQRAVKGKAVVEYAQGCNIYADETTQKGATFGRPIPRVNDAEAQKEALQLAQRADVIVCAMGEMAEMSGESSSRSDLALPDVQMQLLQKLVALGKPLVLLNFSGRPTIMKWESEHVPAIMNVWFAGSEAGDAISDVLFGDQMPSGKLTTTFPQSLGQIPLYYNHLNTGRPVAPHAKEYQKFQSNYIDVRNDPLYPFGYGLSYTTFSYSDITLSGKTLGRDGKLTATVTVTNTGSRDGDEIVQMYTHDPAARVARPVKELKGFRRIHLKAGESTQVSFEITPELLKYYDADLNHVIDPGEIEVMVGPDSDDRNLRKSTITVL